MSDRVSAPFTLRLLRRYSHVPEASLMSSGTVPMVALAPVKLPLRSDPAKLPVRRDASNATGDDGLPMRIARLLNANCFWLITPFEAARCSGELPRRPLSTGALTRALATTGPPGRL